jgi:hypothetical protein
MDNLPAMTDERSTAVRRFHRAQYRAAYKIILRELPRIARSYRILSASMGDVSVDILSPKSPASRSVNIPV